MSSHHAWACVLSKVTVCFCVALTASAVAAQAPTDDATRAAARQLGEQGVEAFWAHDYAAANDSLDKAYRLFATPTLGLWSARARASVGQLVEAAERYRETMRISDVVGDSAAQKQAQQDAAKDLAELRPRIPTLTIQLNVPASKVALSIDGVAISSELVGVKRPTNPGTHRVVATLGAERREAQVQLAEHDDETVLLQLPSQDSVAPLQPTAARTARRAGASTIYLPVAITAIALGGAGLATGGISALVANGKCSGGICKTPSEKSSYDTLRTVSSISFWAGAVLAAGGVATWLLAPKRSEEPQAGLRWDIGPTGVAVGGAF